MMRRRTLLRAIGATGLAGFAGCTGLGEGPGDGATDEPAGSPTDDGTGTPTDAAPSDATHRVTVTGADDAPDLPVDPSATVVDPYATGDSPPVLRVDVANPTDDPISIGEYRAVVFQYVHSDDGTLVWLPHSKRSTEGEPTRTQPNYEVAGDGCWRLAEEIAVTMEYGVVEIPAGGTLTAFVGLYGTPDASDCLSAGDHRFETTYSVSPHFEKTATATDEQPETSWGFSVTVAEL